MHRTGAVRICLAILTTGDRPEGLRACLGAVAALEVPDDVALDILLVQNGSEAPVPEIFALAENFAGTAGTCSVVTEPRRGIPFARNEALAYALARQYDYLAFVDDDAAPDRSWLERSWALLVAMGADGVTGPQVPVFPDSAPTQLKRAKIYRERQLEHRAPCRWAATNNVIFSVCFVRRTGLRFNETFLTGGSDKEYFLRFTHAGGVLLWASDAIVRERVQPERLTGRWPVRRAWRLGATGFRIERSIRTLAGAVIVSTFKGSAYLAAGILTLPSGLVPRNPAFVDCLCRLSHGAGFLFGMTPFGKLRRYV